MKLDLSPFDLNVTKLHIATDCRDVLKNLEEGNSCAYGVIVKKFLAKKAMFQAVYLCHEDRE